jgi:predicted acylesterase/phospholipase RssA
MNSDRITPAAPSGLEADGKSTKASWVATSRAAIEAGYEAVKPCRLALTVAVLVPLIFIFVPQGKEVLRCLAEGPAHTGGVRVGRILWIVGGLTGVALAGWWFSMVLLYFKFPGAPMTITRRARRLTKWLPAAIGLIPVLGLGLAFLTAAIPEGEPLPPGVGAVLRWLAVLCFVLSLILLQWFKLRQKHELFHTLSQLELLRFRSKAGSGTGPEARLKRAVKLTVCSAFASSTALFTILLVWPVGASQMMGSTAIILFAAASWIVYGNIAIYFGHQWRLPVMRILLVCAVLSSCWNNNHDIRYLNNSLVTAAPSDFEAHYTSWYSNLCVRYPQEQNPPVIIVATAGGGIRAAVWTATVLGELQDRNPSFADHVFAISGVSGGSLGAAVFAGQVQGAGAGSYRQQAQQVLAYDFLSPTLAYLLFPDMLQQFIPARLGFFEDRAAALELAWEAGWRRTTGNDLFDNDFFSLWQGTTAQRVPSLFLNGTSVETGQRMVVSNLQLDSSFVMAEDINSRLPHPIRLSTAVNMSTRFSFVSPSGRFHDRRHIVDGGYFENSGSATVLDILDAIDSVEFSQTNRPSQIVIVISNDPDENQVSPPKSEFLGEALTPFHSLLSTRQARGTYAETQLRMRVDRTNFYRFSLITNSLATNRVSLPLGWALSQRAIEEMNQRLNRQEERSFTVVGRLPRSAPPLTRSPQPAEATLERGPRPASAAAVR